MQGNCLSFNQINLPNILPKSTRFQVLAFSKSLAPIPVLEQGRCCNKGNWLTGIKALNFDVARTVIPKKWFVLVKTWQKHLKTLCFLQNITLC